MNKQPFGQTQGVGVCNCLGSSGGADNKVLSSQDGSDPPLEDSFFGLTFKPGGALHSAKSGSMKAIFPWFISARCAACPGYLVHFFL